MSVENDVRPVLTDKELETMSKDDLAAKWKQLDKYTSNLEEKHQTNLAELVRVKNIILMNYISSKEMESAETVNGTSTNTANNSITSANVDSGGAKSAKCFVDPCINSMIVHLKKELDETRKKKDELQMDLDATKMTPDSQLVKRLMTKCRKLLSENEELGKIISSGNFAQLEHDLAYHKQLLNEANQNEQNINSFLFEIDNEMENMQSMLIKLKNEKKSTEEKNNNEEEGKDSSEKKAKKKKTK